MKVLLSKLAVANKLPKKCHHDDWWDKEEAEGEDGSSTSSISKEIEELIESCLDHFAQEDAIVLAEAYHNRVKTERSLFILSQTLARSGKQESAYHLLKSSDFDSAQCRYLYAKCAYSLNRLQESEAKLRDDKSQDFALHPVFNGTPTLPFAHSLLAKILGDTNRADVAKNQLIRSIKSNSLLWSNVKSFCDNNVDGEVDVKDLFPKSSSSSSEVMSCAKQKRLMERKAERLKTKKMESSESTKKTPMNVNCSQLTTPATATSAMNTGPLQGAAARKRAPPPAPKKKSFSHTSTLIASNTTSLVSRHRRVAPSSVESNVIETRRSLRLYSAQEDENSSKYAPVREVSVLSTKTRVRGTQVIPTNPCKILFDDNPDILKQEMVKQVRRTPGHPLSSVNTTNTTTTIALGLQRGNAKEVDIQKEEMDDEDLVGEEPMDMENAENDPFQRDAKPGCAASESVKKDEIYCETLDWMTQLAQVQEHLSHFRCSEAMNLLDSCLPLPFTQLALSMELRARIFFENGEYQRACEIFEELLRLYPHRVEGMEVFSTALWQLQDQHRLSALCSELTTNAREQPETWCVAGNCFSLEKQHETAVECLERAIRLDSRFGYAYSLLGHELIILNDLSRASQAFRQAIVCSPNDYRAWYGLGLVHFKEEQLMLARMNLVKAVGINPTNAIVLCQLSLVEQTLANTDLAMEYLDRALGYSPNHMQCRYHKARLLFDTGNYTKALEEIMELKALSPDEAHVFYLLGRVYRKLGNHHMALLSYSCATEIDPRGEQNHSALSDQGPYDDDPIDFSETRNSNNSF